MAELAARAGPEADSTMLLTAISDAVERYRPESEAVVLIESEKGFEVSIGLFVLPVARRGLHGVHGRVHGGRLEWFAVIRRRRGCIGSC